MATAVVFPGQGSQFVGMGKDFYDSNKEAKAYFDRADEVLGYKLSDIMFSGSAEQLTLTQNTQPALLTMSVAIWEILKDKVNPAYFAGHSLGEYSAVVAAGGISFDDAVKAVHNRGKFMQDAVPVGTGGMMAVLGASDADVIAVCKQVSTADGIVEPANFNCDGQVVVAGHKHALEKFAIVMKEKGAKRIMPLPVSAPFHCSLMNPATEKMAAYFKNVELHNLRTPVINNVDAAIEVNAPDVKDALIRQISGAVKWTYVVKELVNKGCDRFIEVGAGSVLTGLIKKIDSSVTCVSIAKVEDLSKC